MGGHAHLLGRHRHPRGWRRRIVVALLLLITLLVAGYAYLTRPRRLAQLAGEALTQITGADVDIRSAVFGLDGTITLRGVRLSIPDANPEAGRVFDAEQVMVAYNIGSLFHGDFQARSFTFIHPRLYLTENLDDHKYNFQKLQEQRTASLPRQPMPTQLPELFIRQGQAQFGQVEGGRYTAVGDMDFSGNLTQIERQAQAYRFILRQEGQGPDPATIRGRLDMAHLAFRATLHHFTFSGEQRHVLPSNFRDWWDRLEPAGSLSDVRVSFDPDPAVGFAASIGVRDVALTLPYDQIKARFTHVTGRFDATRGHIDITDLTGQIGDLHYQVHGRVDGLAADAPFNLAVHIDPFAVPQVPQNLLALPKIIQEQFHKFSPSGVFEAQVNVTRAKPDGDIAYDGHVTLNDVKGRYNKFPYPIEDLHGQLTFTQDQINVIALHGRETTGAVIAISGAIAPPNKDAAVHFDVVGSELPTDKYLRDALPGDNPELIDSLLDTKVYQRLVDADLIQSPADKSRRQAELKELTAQRARLSLDQPADMARIAELDKRIAALAELAAIPEFELGGKLSMVVKIDRRPGPNQPNDVVADVQLAGVNVLSGVFPYPGHVVKGTLHIAPGRIELRDVEFRGLTGVHGVLAGYIDVPHNGHPAKAQPHLTFHAQGAPIDKLLLNALPPIHSRWLTALQVRGDVDLTGSAFRSEETGNIDFDIRANLAGGVASPFGGRFILDPVMADLRIHRRFIEIESVRARYNQARIQLTGKIGWEGSQKLDLAFFAQDMDLANPVLDLLPPDLAIAQQARKEFIRFNPSGLFDARLDFHVPDKAAPPDYRLVIQPHGLGFDFHGQRVSLSDMTGQIVFDRDGLALHDCHAALGRGVLDFSGKAQFGDDPILDLNLGLHHARLDKPTRALLPPSFADVLALVDPASDCDVTDAHLFYRPQAKQGPTLDVAADIRLANASAKLGVELTDLAGGLTLRARQQAGQAIPQIQADARVQHFTIASRVVGPLSFQVVSDPQQPGRLEVRGVRGEIYGGTILGQGDIQTEKSKDVRLDLTLQDVALEPLTDPGKWPNGKRPTSARPNANDATLSASLALQATPGDAASRQGRGRIEIHNASLFKTPLTLAILQIINLAWPSATSFDRAQASYIIDGPIVRFESIRFETPTIEVVGSGAIALDTRQVDMTLHTYNPTGLKLGPLSDIVGLLKDELISLHVGGTLDHPVPEVRSLSGLRDSWQRLFRPFTPRLPATKPQPLAGAKRASNPGQ